MFKLIILIIFLITEICAQSLNDLKCGIAEVDIEVTALVANGQSFKKGSWPWMAGLLHNGKYICAGSLSNFILVQILRDIQEISISVSASHVITAAHCVQDKSVETPLNAKNAFFVVGKHNLDSDIEEEYETCLIDEFIMHDDWKNNLNFRSYDADIAIAVLKNPIDFTRYIKPICLFPSRKDIKDVVNQVGRIAGWGGTTTAHLSTKNPLATKMRIVDSSECIEDDSAFAFIMSHSSICSIGNATGVCKGDSGSGLMLKLNDKWTLRGILSATTQTNCVGGNYVTFTDAAHFTDWINGIVENG